MAEQENRHTGGKITLGCAFCGETGTDPFGLLSRESRCQVCAGSGRVVIPGLARECAYCRGTGVHPHRRMVCTVCTGKGKISVRQPFESCTHCLGKGFQPGQYLPCLNCGGKGVVAKESAVGGWQ